LSQGRALRYASVMPTTWPELSTLVAFTSLTEEARRSLAARIAAALGAAYAAHSDLVGAARLPAVRHEPTGLVFAAVPGGTFTMGLRDDETEDLRRTVLRDDPKNRFDREIAGHHIPQMTPAHEVEVRPFLCATDFITAQGEPVTEDYCDDPSITAEYAAEVVAKLRAHGQRLLSDAEWEWVAREGGRRSWILDVTGKWGMGLDDMREDPANAWGIRRLKSAMGEFVADGWHPSYVGAPSDSRPWDPDPSGKPGVHRGAHSCWQDDMEAVTCHAALREMASGDGAVRAAIDLPAV
jgi:formylglycine-generating enzyme required for sulfatase activity